MATTRPSIRVPAAGPGPVRPTGPVERAADLGGQALSVLINRVYGLGRARPLHPRGEARAATWTVEASGLTPTGAPCLDRSGTRHCLVRHSRAVGLPSGWPDIEGIAVRLEAGADDPGGDILLAGTGDGFATRHVLWPRRTDGTCTTLFPLCSPSGPVLVRLSPSGPDAWRISWARPGGDWHACGTLALEDRPVPPSGPHFDPVLHAPEGLEHYRTAALLRRTAYVQARRQA